MIADNNTALCIVGHLVDLENHATSDVADRLNASTNQPAAYPICKRAANVIEEIIERAIDRVFGSK